MRNICLTGVGQYLCKESMKSFILHNNNLHYQPNRNPHYEVSHHTGFDGLIYVREKYICQFNGKLIGESNGPLKTTYW